MALNDNGQFPTSFQGTTSYIPLVGVLLNKYENFQNFTPAKYNIEAGSGQAVAGDPIIVLNEAGTSHNANAIEGLNATTGKITEKASSIDELSGFLLQSPTDVVPIQGGEAYPVDGFLSYVALLGSGAELYLPCDYSLIGANMATRVTYDFGSGILRQVVTGTDVPIPARIKSGVVAGKQLIYDDESCTASWNDCTCILVELNNMIETQEST